MGRNKVILLPRLSGLLQELGANIRLARLRRRLSTEQISERAGITRPTLAAIESGKPSVSIGHVLTVLMVLGMENDLKSVALDDVLGRKLQDLQLPVKKRAPKRKR
tara:strand:- start:222 stop:539 length:318 start_codon:yes stop_codon:yes gene_type:complete